jgi:hypothetical protein
VVDAVSGADMGRRPVPAVEGVGVPSRLNTDRTLVGPEGVGVKVQCDARGEGGYGRCEQKAGEHASVAEVEVEV